MNIKNYFAKYYVNLRGWSTSRKIVVIESDDWGSIRTPSLTVFNLLNDLGHPLKKSKFTSLDGLERKEDLSLLFEVLKEHRDSKGNHPVVTALSLVANPDFEMIRESGFKNYYFKSLEDTYKSYNEDGLLELWIEEGIKDNLLYPQFHGREHLNPTKWLEILQSKNRMEMDAFVHQALLGIIGNETLEKDNYMSAFESTSELHKRDIENITIDGLNLFKKTFGFSSLSFMPSQSKQFEELNKTLVEHGVLFNQGGHYLVPEANGGFRAVNKFWGDKDQYGMTYWRRNCMFEPYQNHQIDHVNSCLKEIEIAFRCRKPAVISSHRINFTSRLNVDNRDYSLKELNKLLSEIIIKWPDVEFMNSEELGKLMLSTEK